MCNIERITKSCGTLTPPGTKLVLYLIPKEEILAWPTVGNTVYGDAKTLTTAWSLTTDVDKGYWRRADILVNSGNLKVGMEGEIGGQGWKQRLEFFVEQMTKDKLQWADDLLACSGCLIAMIQGKDGNMFVLGDLDNPVFLEAGEGGTGGDKSGILYTLYADTGKTPYIYTHATIDITPNAA